MVFRGKKRKIRTRIKKRQQGKGFPIGLIASATAPLLGEIARPIFKTIFGREGEKTMREKILLQRRVFPKKDTLPNGKTFYVKYERTSRRNLPSNVTIRKNRTNGPRQQRIRKTQQGRSILGNIGKLGAKLRASNLLKQGVSAGTKTLSSDKGKRLIDEGIKQAPDLYRFGTSKIKSENVRKALESDVANYIVEETQKKAKKTLIICLVGNKK